MEQWFEISICFPTVFEDLACVNQGLGKSLLIIRLQQIVNSVDFECANGMLQDLERGRKTEIDFINGYVVALGHASGMLVPMNATITDLVHQIERGVLQPARERMNELADQTGERSSGNSI